MLKLTKHLLYIYPAYINKFYLYQYILISIVLLGYASIRILFQKVQ